MSTSQEVADSLAPLFERADREGLWFHSAYQDIWLSPDELRCAQAQGRFRWGAVNWTLRNPSEKYEALRKSGLQTLEEADRFRECR